MTTDSAPSGPARPTRPPFIGMVGGKGADKFVFGATTPTSGGDVRLMDFWHREGDRANVHSTDRII